MAKRRPKPVPPPLGAPPPASEAEGYYDAYSAFARQLRVWFIAYGIGAPLIALTNPAVAEAVRLSGYRKSIAFAFVGGVTVQILMAFLYKTAMWYLYAGEDDPTTKGTWQWSASDRFSEWYWAEALVDVVTLAAFSYGTYRLISVLAS
jgi:hypothetical protein